jgi:hypothetical protein
MISSTHPPATGADAGPPDDVAVEPLDDGPVSPRPATATTRARHARRPSAWWRFGFPIAMALLILAIPVLVVLGVRVVLDSSDGRLVNRVTDPSAPGWEAVLDPTPTELVLTLDEGEQLQSIAVLILSGEGSGAVLQVPAETLYPVDDNGGELSLAYAWFVAGIDGVRFGLGEILNLSFSDTRVLAPQEWAALVDPLGPLTVNSPDAAVGPDGVVVFPRGSIQVPAEDVPAYLSTRGANETDVARLVRVEAFWRAWLGAVGVAGPGALPEPVDEGLGRFVATLSSEQVQFVTLPVEQVPDEATELYRADPAEAAQVVGALVPFPAGPPGARPTVRVLDGTGQLDHGVSAAIAVGAAGGEVKVIGNASDFDVATTEIVYYEDDQRAAAEALRDALGIGEVVRSESKSPVAVTVVLGADALEVPALAPVPTVNSGEPGA